MYRKKKMPDKKLTVFCDKKSCSRSAGFPEELEPEIHFWLDLWAESNSHLSAFEYVFFHASEGVKEYLNEMDKDK